jgi:hypothetical protein
MKHVWGKVCRASVAAAGVAVFASAANAENRPLEFETEFDLGISPAAAAIKAELAPTAAAWQESIGSYLEQLLDAAKEVAPQLAPVAQDETVQAAVDAELSAFAAAAAKPLPPELLDVLGIEFVEEDAAPKISLAPYPSEAHDCELCHAAGEWVEVKNAEQAAAPAEGLVDDAAAWDKLAEWASSRIEADDAPAAEDAFDAFFSDSSLAD